MNIFVKKFNYALATVAFTATSLLTSASTAFAASASLSLTPAAYTAAPGTTFDVAINVNTAGNAVNAVQANLTYPDASLEYVSTASSSAFPVEAQTTGGGGTVKIARGTISPPNGTQIVATVKFKAKATSGTAAINFAKGTQVAVSQTPIFEFGKDSATGATITFKTAASPTAAASTNSQANTKDVTPPVISNVKVSDIKTRSVTISWTSSEPANSGVSYGINSNYGLSASSSTLVTEHKVVLDNGILPATTYHFTVKGTDAAGNSSAATKDQTFTTAGLNVPVKVLDQQSKPVADATVQYQKSTAKTDSNGQATLKGLPSGKLTIAVSQGGKQTPVTVVIVANDNDTVKPITLKINTVKESPAKLIGIIVLIAAAIMLIVVIIRHIRRGKSGGSGVITPLPVAVDNDPDLKPQTTSAVPPPAEPEPAPAPAPKPDEPLVFRPNITTGDDE